MRRIIYSLLLSFLFSLSMRGQNLILNGGFSAGDINADCVTSFPPASESFGPDHWYLALENPNNCLMPKQCPTADWFRNSCVSLASERPPDAQVNTGCIGMGRNYSNDSREGVRTPLTEALIPEHMYELTLSMALNKNLVLSPPFYANNKLEIGFTTWGLHWNSSGSGNMKWYDITDMFTIPASSPMQWYTYSYKFTCPKEIDGESTEGMLRNLVIRQTGANPNDSYIYIDDIQLLHLGDPCRSKCTPAAAMDTIEFTAGLPNSNIHFGKVDTYKLAIENATKVRIQFYDRWGAKFYDELYEDPNVLKFPGLPYFGVEWGATRQDGSPVPEGVYVMHLFYKNCVTPWTEKVIDVTYIYDSTGNNIIHIPDYVSVHIDTLANCCIDNRLINHITYTSDAIEAVNKKIWAGTYITSHLVSVNAGARVYYSAGEEIKLLGGFQVNPGGKFTARIQPCQAAPKVLTGKKGNNGFVYNGTQLVTDVVLNKLKQNQGEQSRFLQEGQVTIFPNPFNDMVNLQCAHCSGSLDYEVYDMAGRLLKTGLIQPAQTSIVMPGLLPGAYMLCVKGSGFSRNFKLIKID